MEGNIFDSKCVRYLPFSCCVKKNLHTAHQLTRRLPNSAGRRERSSEKDSRPVAPRVAEDSCDCDFAAPPRNDSKVTYHTISTFRDSHLKYSQTFRMKVLKSLQLLQDESFVNYQNLQNESPAVLKTSILKPQNLHSETSKLSFWRL